MSKTPKPIKPKTESVIAIRPRVGSVLAEVRKAVVASGGNMGDVVHTWAEKHRDAALKEVDSGLPSFD